jgi:hypothetical protein
MAQDKIKQLDQWTALEAKAINRLAESRLVPLYHDTVTWALHETDGSYTTEARIQMGFALLNSLACQIIDYSAAQTVNCCQPHHRGAMMGLAGGLIENLRLALGMVPDFEPLSVDMSKGEAFERISGHVADLYERFAASVKALTPATKTSDLTAQMILVGLLTVVAKQYRVTRDPETMIDWVRTVVTGLGVDTKNLVTEIREGPPPR